jgi:hypothetical protein
MLVLVPVCLCLNSASEVTFCQVGAAVVTTFSGSDAIRYHTLRPCTAGGSTLMYLVHWGGYKVGLAA